MLQSQLGKTIRFMDGNVGHFKKILKHMSKTKIYLEEKTSEIFILYVTYRLYDIARRKRRILFFYVQ